MKYLIVINDQFIRKGAFAQAEKLIKKLDRLEVDLDSFRDHDQRLFSSWYDLTFREQRQNITEQEDIYQSLCKFHNWMIALTEMHHISMPRAYFMLQQEEEHFKNGTDKERSEIEALRFKRDEFIRRQISAENNYSDIDDDDIDEEIERGDSEESSELNLIREMSDVKLQKLCMDRGGAFAILSMMLRYANSSEDYALLLRIWEMTPEKHQLAFSKEYAKQTGKSLKKFIEETREFLKATLSPEEDDFDEDEEDLSNEEFIGSRSSSRKPFSGFAPKMNAEDLEGIKLLYRKLVRQLHPDLQGSAQNQWQKKMWDRVQAANRRLDRRQLEKLLRLVMIRNRSLNDLTISEILESKLWLKEELDNLSDEARGLKKLPAWGFSRKRDLSSLKRKLSKPLETQLFELHNHIAEIKRQHAALERMNASRQKQLEESPRRPNRNRRRDSEGTW